MNSGHTKVEAEYSNFARHAKHVDALHLSLASL